MAYNYWGSWSAWNTYEIKQEKLKQAKQFLATIKSPTELIEKLKTQLIHDPDNANGWYLLARMYANQNSFSDAKKAIKRAYKLNPAELKLALYYVDILMQMNNQQFDRKAQHIVNAILIKNPNQPDALAMQAIDAFNRKNYELAEKNWLLLLKLVPDNSKEARALKKALVQIKSLKIMKVS